MAGASAKTRIALGQTGLIASILLCAAFLGLVPDRMSAVREGRAALAEALAANSSILVSEEDLRRLEADLRLVVERNDDLRSAALRRTDGRLMAIVGDHVDQWQSMPGQYSTASQVRVPILANQDRWGQIELRFRPLVSHGWLASFTENPWARLVGFVAVFAFIAFYFYLGKMLKHLDPSQAVPSRVRSALDTMAEGLLVLDPKENIVLANQAFAKMLDKTPDDLVGRHASVFPWQVEEGVALQAEDCPWVKTLEEGVPQRNTMLRLALGESRTSTFMVNCSPVLGGTGKPQGVLVSFDDVTELEHKEVELRKSKEAAEEANRAKSDFLANMSHEIRTPMNAILGFTEVLKRGYGKDAQESRRHLDTIHSSGTHLLDLINDVLDLSKVEAGRLEVESIRFAPHVILQETVKVLGVKARERGIGLEFVADGELPATILSDSARLRQIVTNLVGNAIKFTEEGGVSIVARLNRDGERPQLAIDVTDTGVGMPADRLDKIFDAFTQADNSVSRKFGGTGLGLSISLRFARALGGDIAVRSAPGAGSTFTVSIDTGPLDDVEMLAPSALVLAQDDAVEDENVRWEFPEARLLVVDDGRENRELVRLVLEDVGLVVEEAEDGAVGVDKTLTGSFDLILMDVQMPIMDGFTATRTLRERGVEVPIIALTANAMKGFEQECLACGFTAYMTKPIDIDALISTLGEQLGGKRVQVEAALEIAQVETTPADAAALARGQALDAVDETGVVLPGIGAASTVPAKAGPPIESTLAAANPRFAPLVRRFVERLHEQLAAMEAALVRRDLHDLALLGHWLKGAGGSVGFGVLTEPARSLEQLAKSGEITGIETSLRGLREIAARIVAPPEADPARTEESGTPPPVGRTVTAPDREPVESRLAGVARLRPIISRFVTRAREKTAAMEEAWNRKDLDELAALAHWLKGSGGTVGFDQFTEPAQTLEKLAKAGDETAIPAVIAAIRELAMEAVSPEVADESTGESPLLRQAV